VERNRVWDVRSKSVRKTIPTPAPITSIELSQDKSIITTAGGKDIQFWDAKRYKAKKKKKIVYSGVLNQK
jgi:WD40 repeat protein